MKFAWQNDFKNILKNSYIAQLRATEVIDKLGISWYLSSKYFKGKLERLAQGKEAALQSAWQKRSA
ncbi:hypothetical protein V2P20_05005 [Methylobacter sp. Wu1]|uniref:hypothetical protein n=1 Tax=Methylobacter sp. Wu1 TaxID=3119359 RepID=UPI002F924753